jgi:hypothetical protein
MSSPIITKVIEEMNDLPDDLQQRVLKFVVSLRQHHQQKLGDAWDVLESLTGTVEAPADWSAHKHDLYGDRRIDIDCTTVRELTCYKQIEEDNHDDS